MDDLRVEAHLWTKLGEANVFLDPAAAAVTVADSECVAEVEAIVVAIAAV